MSHFFFSSLPSQVSGELTLPSLLHLTPLLFFTPGHRRPSLLELREIIVNHIIIAFLACPDMANRLKLGRIVQGACSYCNFLLISGMPEKRGTTFELSDLMLV
jgi:hypothetical protein